MRKFCATPVTWFSASKKEIAAPTAPSDFSGPLHRLGAGLGCALSGTWTDRNICGAPGEVPWGGHILPNMDKRGQEPQSPPTLPSGDCWSTRLICEESVFGCF